MLSFNEKGGEEEEGEGESALSFYSEAHDYNHLSVPFDRNENTHCNWNEAFSLDKANN